MTAGVPPRESRPRIGFRADVEGLRGIATALVLLYHAELPGLSGGYVGMDVFFVLSGFLITALLLREIQDTGRLSLGSFYARRIRRLLPSVLVVLVVIVALGELLMSPLQRESLAVDVIAANLYFVNWRFADQQLDYLQRDAETSPVQHFWSLSVEEQFYIVWPVLLIAATWWLVRRGLDPRWGIGAAVLAVWGGLLAYSVVHTAEAGGAAYFSTLTRGWEFAVGAAVALIPASRLRLPPWAAGVVVVAALGVLTWASLSFDEFTAFPGAAALVPALAAAAIIAAGLADTSNPAARLISVRPARWVGRISYSWYLWHWPLLVFAGIALGPLEWWWKAAIVAASVGPALAAHHLVEEPCRRARALARPQARTYRLALAGTALVTVVGVAAWSAVPTVPVASASEAVGARALAHDTALQTTARAIRPAPRSAIRDRGRADADGCLVSQRATRSGACVYGDASSDTTVVLFGDSHAMQYATPLETIADQRGWRLVVLTKSGCTPALVRTYNTQYKRRYRECENWRAHTMKRIARERPGLIVTGNLDTHRVMRGGRRLDEDDSARALSAGYVRALRRLRATTGARLVVMRGNPRPPLDVRSCVSRSLKRLARCAFPRSAAFDHAPVNIRAARQVSGVRLIDPARMLCPGRVCPAVIGNVLVYRNTAHITATYAGTLAPWLARRLPAPARGR